jgi:hypothetical protein
LIDDGLKNPAQALQIRAAFATFSMLKLYRQKVQVTDDEVKSQNDLWDFKRIFVANDKAGTGGAVAKANQILTEIKGGITFEKAMERYSNDPPSPGKKIGDSLSSLSALSLRTDPSLQPLLQLKPGQTSEAISLVEGAAIYKLVAVKPNPIKDFEKKRAEERSRYIDSIAGGQFSKEFEEYKKTAKVDWKDKGFELLSEYGKLGFSQTGGDRPTKLKDIVERAKKVLEDSSQVAAGRSATLAYFAAFNEIYTSAPKEEQAKMLDERVQVYERILANSENVNLRLDLVEMMKTKKNNEAVFQNLYQAAMANSYNMEAMGKSNHDLIEAEFSKAKVEKLFSAEQVKQLQDAQAEWRRNKADRDKAEAEQKAQMEADQKRFEEEQKKAAKEKAPVPIERGEAPKKAGN